jgi:hypothetical protein
MRKVLICILMVLFTGLMAFGGQSINGPGVQVVDNETTISPALIGFPAVIPAWEKCSIETAITAASLETATIYKSFAVIPSNVLTGIPASGRGTVILITKGHRTFERTVQANSIDGKGGVLSFDGAMRHGV